MDRGAIPPSATGRTLYPPPMIRVLRGLARLVSFVVGILGTAIAAGGGAAVLISALRARPA